MKPRFTNRYLQIDLARSMAFNRSEIKSPCVLLSCIFLLRCLFS